jgi:hypothetical protein
LNAPVPAINPLATKEDTMPDGDQPPHPGDPKAPEPEIADAELLFQEVAPPARSPRDLGLPPASETDEVIELAHPAERREVPSTQAPEPGPRAQALKPPPLPAPTPPLPPAGTGIPETARDREFRAASRSAFGPANDVDQVWSRRLEWGPTLAALAAWTIIFLGLLYVAIATESFTLAFVALILGGLYWLYLCYPILITLEIPVRLTPESAVKDYYGALSHHMPHYRRMWLLLGRQARLTPYFGSFEGFRAYWKARVNELKEQGHAGPTTPLQFQVERFDSDKSSGKAAVGARFEVQVFVRGRRDEGAVATIPMRIELVRGPDKMWYLGDGTLPENPEIESA